jgi:catechol 2,3-dioxygenase-like lactoylglutathione lyase family enzyme
LLLTVPTYVGHQVDLPGMDYAEPKATLAAYKDRGVRIVLGSHDSDDPMPDAQIERRPHSWAIFLHPLGGSDPCAHVYFHDDGRSWLLKEQVGPTPELIEVADLPHEIDA